MNGTGLLTGTIQRHKNHGFYACEAKEGGGLKLRFQPPHCNATGVGGATTGTVRRGHNWRAPNGRHFHCEGTFYHLRPNCER